jgi:hypothetical protein
VVRFVGLQRGGPSAELVAAPTQSHALANCAWVQSFAAESWKVHAYCKSMAAGDVSVFHSRPLSGSVPRLYVPPAACRPGRGVIDSIMCGSMPSCRNVAGSWPRIFVQSSCPRFSLKLPLGSKSSVFGTPPMSA